MSPARDIQAGVGVGREVVVVQKALSWKRTGGKEKPQNISEGDLQAWSCKEEVQVTILQHFLGAGSANKTEKSDTGELGN